MGRHSAPAVAGTMVAGIAAEPAPGSRRARVRAERAQRAASIERAESKQSAFEAPVADTPVWPNRAEFAASLKTETPISIHKSSKFSLFKRSRAVTAAVVIITSGVGAVAVTQSSSSAETTIPSQTQSSVPHRTIAQEVATTFTVKIDGAEKTVSSNKATLGDALADAGVVVNRSDIVSSAMSAPVVNGSTISVTRVTTANETETVKDAFATKEVDDDSLEKGTTQVETEGQDGITTNTYEVTYHDGKEVSRVLTISAVTQPRVDKVVHVGTKEPEVTEVATTTTTASSSASATSSSTSDSSSSTTTASTDSSASAAGSGVWAQLAQCESGGNPNAVSSNGLYYGLYQFTVSTWQSVGGSGLPSQASADEQTLRAQILQQRSGWGQWPACARSLGLY